MTNNIYFSEKLQQKLNALLDQAGFVLHHYYKSRPETLVYRRYLNTGKFDQLSINGTEDPPDYVFALALSGKSGDILTSIRLLEDENLTLDTLESTRWDFHDEAELEVVLSEIVDLVVQKLLPWFDEPSDTTTFPKRDIITKMKHDIEKANALRRKHAEELRSKGKIDEALKLEQDIQAFENFLKDDSAL